MKATLAPSRNRIIICKAPDGEILRGWGYQPDNLRDSDGFSVEYRSNFRCKTVKEPTAIRAAKTGAS